MKKLIMILLALTLTTCMLFGLTACGSAKKEDETTATCADDTDCETTEAESADDATDANAESKAWFSIDGTFINIELEANATTGYQWTYAIADEKIVEYVSDAYTPDSNDDNLCGVGGIYSASFLGASAGETDITFTYARSWETTDSDIVRTLHVTVGEDGTVTAQEITK